jgi:DNA-binding transcriptional MerR regulator
MVHMRAQRLARPVGPRQSPRVAERMPIEELARRTGMTVRNLRALQARGLLEPPELEGRKGYYAERHLARVALVRRMQSRGFSLESIKEVLASWEAGAGLMEVVGFEDAMTTPGAEGPRREVDAANTADGWPELLAHPSALKKALANEIVVRRDGRFVAPNAEVLALLKAKARAGWPVEVVVEEAALLRDDMERIAERLRKSFYRHVADPFVAAGLPASELGKIAEKVARLRPGAVRFASILLSQAIERGGKSRDQGAGPGAPRAKKKGRRR